MDGNSTCVISKQFYLADLLRKTDLIIWDEAPLMHRNVLEVFEKSLTDIVCNTSIANENKVFGGKKYFWAGTLDKLFPLYLKVLDK